MRPLALFAAAAIALSMGAKAESPALSLPTYTPAYEPRSVDERGLWMEADEAERLLRDSALRIRDPNLQEYVTRILCRTVGEDRCKSVRIYVLEVPVFNASMAPNGTMIIWSGLLLRTRNEAELASVLGHEFAHFELRHSLDKFKAHRTAGDIVAWLQVLGGLTNTDTGLSQILTYGSFFRFSREQEQEADLLGLRYLYASPYPARSAADVWRSMMAESDATAAGRKRKARQRYNAGYFDSHPTDLKRATYLNDAAARFEDGSEDGGSAAYRIGMSKHMGRLLDAQVKLNDFGGTEYLLGQLASASGWTGELLFARGELYRLRGNPRDLISAAQFYGEAIAKGYAAPEARRNLGLALLRSGQAEGGKAALQDYLRLNPNAADAKTIASLLAN